jgi:hypothetical protein
LANYALGPNEPTAYFVLGVVFFVHSLSFGVFLFVFAVLGLELRAFTLSHSTSPIFYFLR